MGKLQINLLQDHPPLLAVRFSIALTHRSRANPLIDNGSPTSNPGIAAEKERERHGHLKEAKVDKDRTGLEVKLNFFSDGRTFFSLYRGTIRAGIAPNTRESQNSSREMRRK